MLSILTALYLSKMLKRSLLVALSIAPAASIAQLPREFSYGPMTGFFSRYYVAWASLISTIPFMHSIRIDLGDTPGYTWESHTFIVNAGYSAGQFVYLQRQDGAAPTGFIGIRLIRATVFLDYVNQGDTMLPLLIDDRTDAQKASAPKITSYSAIPFQAAQRAGGKVGILGAEVVTPQVGMTFNPAGFTIEASIDGGPLTRLSNIGNLVYLGGKVLYNVKLPPLPSGGAAVTLIARYQQTPGDNTNVGFSYQRFDIEGLKSNTPASKVPRASVRHRTVGTEIRG